MVWAYFPAYNTLKHTDHVFTKCPNDNEWCFLQVLLTGMGLS